MISFGDYLRFVHDLLKKPLREQIVNHEFSNFKRQRSGKRIFIVGSFLSNPDVIDVIENNDMIIIGDNLPESGRIISTPEINLNSDIYKANSKSILFKKLSPSQNNFDEILKADINEIKNKNADGVIFITQQYCEAYDFLFYVYKKALDEINIPILKIALPDSESTNKVNLSIEAFRNILGR